MLHFSCELGYWKLGIISIWTLRKSFSLNVSVPKISFNLVNVTSFCRSTTARLGGWRSSRTNSSYFNCGCKRLVRIENSSRISGRSSIHCFWRPSSWGPRDCHDVALNKISTRDLNNIVEVVTEKGPKTSFTLSHKETWYRNT